MSVGNSGAEMLVMIVKHCESQLKDIYSVMSVFPFDKMRERLEEEISWATNNPNIKEQDIKISQLRIDMLESIYNELHGYAVEVDRLIKEKEASKN